MNYNDVRTVSGTPHISDFASKTGTPLVIDKDTGYGYYADGSDVKSIDVNPATSHSQNGCGGMGIDTNRAITLNAGWTRIVNFNNDVIVANLGVDTDLVAGTLTPLYACPALVTVVFDLRFTEENTGKNYKVRVYDVTTNTQVWIMEVAVGRNTAGSIVSFPALVNILNAGHKFAIEVGNGDTFANCSLTDAQFSLILLRSISFIPPSTNNAWDDGFDDGFS